MLVLGFFSSPGFWKRGVRRLLLSLKQLPKIKGKESSRITVPFLSNIKSVMSFFLPEGRAGPLVLGAPGSDNLKLKLFNPTFLGEMFLWTF